MYKWHVNSAIGRGRPLANDFLRAADGIAASLRQFSVSISRAAEDEDYPQITRRQTAKEAFGAVSSLANSNRGVDARSLAATPPQGLKISRHWVESPNFPDRTFGGANYRGGMRGRGSRGRGAGRGGRGDRGGRGKRNKRSKGKGTRNSQQKGEEDEMEEEAEYTDEEKKLQDLIHGGFPTPYEPTTTLESLGTPVLSSPRGLIENVKYKMQVATNNTNGRHKMGGEHLARMGRAEGTIFESPEAKIITEKFNNQIREERAKVYGWEYEPEKLGTLSEVEREKIAKAWAAGHYELPKLAGLDDFIGQVEAYARRNETYLNEDGKKLEEKLRTLLPAQFIKKDLTKALPKVAS